MVGENVYTTENYGSLEFDAQSYQGFMNLEQEYRLMEAYCVTRQEWGYLGRASCGFDCMCAAVYFPPDATGEEMREFHYIETDKGEAISRECVRAWPDHLLGKDGARQ